MSLTSKFICSVFLASFIFCTSAYAVDVSAKSAVLIEADSGDTVYEKNADIRMPMASTTKIMTAIVAIENCPLDKEVKITKESVGIEGSSIYLHEGETLTMEQLLYALLLSSANDASVAIATEVGGNLSAFVDMMNEKAKELGLCDTHFDNPHGLDSENHYTTSKDLSKIAAYAMKNPIFADIVSTYKKAIPLNDGEGTRVLVNHNKLLRLYDGAVGIKTGFTKKSGRCLVSCAEVDGVRMICVTLNAPNDWSDHRNMLDYGFSQYENISLADAGSYTLSLDVINGTKKKILCSNYYPVSVTLKKDGIDITASVEVNRFLCAPISQNDVVGQIVFYNNGQKIATADLYALEKADNITYKKSLFERIFS